MNSSIERLIIIAAAAILVGSAKGTEKKKVQEPSALDRYVQEALRQAAPQQQSSAGSLWSPASRLTNLGSDLRASQVDDLVTVIVNEQASAVATGTTKTARTSNVKAQINAIGGIRSPASAWPNLVTAGSATSLDGQGSTSRGATLTTTLSARVTHVLPNGYLVLEGTKNVQVNSENQTVTVRGVVRQTDLSPGNIISSNQIAQMEIRINGKGVVNDAVRRPFFLYRLLLGLLPF